MGVVIFLERYQFARSSTGALRAANRVKSSAVTPASLTRGAASTEAQYPGGIRSRCHHLRAPDTPALISEAMSSALGHSEMIDRKDVISVMPPDLGQTVLNGKVKLSLDCGFQSGQTVLMPNAKARSQFKSEFIARVIAAREARQLTQIQIAKGLGIKQDRYKQYETRSYLPHQFVPTFCLICGVEISWLYSGDRGLTGQFAPRGEPVISRPARKRVKAA